MSDKLQQYIRITDAYGERCTMTIKEGREEIKRIVDNATFGDRWEFEIVEMTEKEWQELPVFLGW